MRWERLGNCNACVDGQSPDGDSFTMRAMLESMRGKSRGADTVGTASITA